MLALPLVIADIIANGQACIKMLSRFAALKNVAGGTTSGYG